MAVKKPLFILSPMDDVTDSVFRRIVSKCAAPDLLFTEFVNVDGLQSPGRAKLLKKLYFTQEEVPLVVQLWGKHPENFKKTAQEIASGSLAQELGLPKGVNFSGVDLNMGCPQKNEVKAGTCSALINDRPLASEIIKATKAGLRGQLPLSVKTRLGWNEIDFSWPEFILNQDIVMLTIHGRTRKEMSKVPAHWDAIGEIVKIKDRIAPQTKLIGNGDVTSREQGVELAEKYNLDGIMIGRGVFQDPYIFSGSSPWPTMTPSDRVKLYKKHVLLFKETWSDHSRPIHTLNKFCKIYINGFDSAKDIREKLMHSTSADELIETLDKISFTQD